MWRDDEDDALEAFLLQQEEDCVGQDESLYNLCWTAVKILNEEDLNDSSGGFKVDAVCGVKGQVMFQKTAF